ncbi:MAG: hypothetical protein MRERV_2c032 [Mycoplasmataceae bacterium RV_VA103A]|nr:MAG: hypothetical protein MRERV_2c032 [Mycoplasmataceae bacterium RV_VA103A]
MVTLQEQFEKDYPNNDVEEIWDENHRYLRNNFTNYDLDLKEYKNLKRLFLTYNKITSISLSGCKELKCLYLYSNHLSSVGFLDTLPNPDKLEVLEIYNNNIEPTNIEMFAKFVNLRNLKIGNDKEYLKYYQNNKRNCFYGSLKSYQNLTRLGSICIEATDVNEGLEYLPMSLAKRTIGGMYGYIECSPHGLEVGCKKIQDQLRKYNYDIEAWQLSHPAEMFRARPELFASEDSKAKWLNALSDKIEKTKTKLKEIKENNPDKVKKIKRLNTKLGELSVVKQLLEERETFEDSLKAGVRWYDRQKEEKGTQTEQAKTRNQETQTKELLEYHMPGSWPKNQ